MRLQKYMAHSGVASRRKSEEIIAAGRVTVNNKIAKDPAYKVKETDLVKVDGRLINLKEEYTYFILNKPKNIITTADDEKGRLNVIELVNTDIRLYPVGRLDKDSTGLLILTNDGELTNLLTHPRYRINKTYLVRVEGIPREEELEVLRKGIMMDGSRNNRCKIDFLTSDNKSAVLEVTINEGKNRQVRRMFEYIGYNVLELKRISIGDIRLRKLKEGKSRPFNKEELRYIRNLKRKHDA